MIKPTIVIRPAEYAEETTWGYEVVRKGTLTHGGYSGCWLVYEARAREFDGHLVLEEKFERNRNKPYIQFGIRDLKERNAVDGEMKERARKHAKGALKSLKPVLEDRI